MMGEALVGWLGAIYPRTVRRSYRWVARAVQLVQHNTKSTVERGTELQPVSTTRPYSYVNHQDDEEMMVMMMMMMVMMAMGMMVTMM